MIEVELKKPHRGDIIEAQSWKKLGKTKPQIQIGLNRGGIFARKSISIGGQVRALLGFAPDTLVTFGR